MKFLPIKFEDIKGKFDLNINLEGTVPFKYFFKKIKNKIYRFSKIGNEEWRQEETPFTMIPFIYFNQKV